MNVRNPNVRFGKPNEIWFGYRTFGFQTFGTNRTNWNKNQFQTGLELFFVFGKPNNFVRISDSAEIRTVWEPNQTCLVQNPNVRISDVYCTVRLSVTCHTLVVI